MSESALAFNFSGSAHAGIALFRPKDGTHSVCV